MQVSMHRCSDCGGGPVKPVDWRSRGPDGVETVKTRCSNCGAIQTADETTAPW